jgi:UDP-N-acetylglucosamine/UDP-N-acetylgalactosamine diphosphorylase
MSRILMRRLERLLGKGVTIPNPAGIEIGDDVDLDRISGDDVVIHSGCKIFGASALALAGVRLGYEAPVTVQDCQLGPGVQLRGGYLRGIGFDCMF